MDILKPGRLVGLKTRVAGLTTYARAYSDAPEHLAPDGGKATRIITDKVVSDVAENERGVKARGKASSLMRAVCQKTDFGLLCPEDRLPELDAAIDAARAVVAEFNATAEHGMIVMRVIKAVIPRDDADTARAIVDEAQVLIDEITSAVANADVNKIREACNTARQLEGLFEAQHAGVLSAAVLAAREVANTVAKAVRDARKRLDKQGAELTSEAEKQIAAATASTCATSSINAARFAFASLGAALDDDAPTLAAPVGRFASIDAALDADEEPAAPAPGPESTLLGAIDADADDEPTAPALAASGAGMIFDSSAFLDACADLGATWEV